MGKAIFVVPVADIERGMRSVTFTLNEAWLRQALEGTDATPRGAGRATVELSKSGRDVLVRGQLEASVVMPCVVSLDPLDIELRSDIFLMLAPSSSESAPRHDKRARSGAKPKPATNEGRMKGAPKDPAAAPRKHGADKAGRDKDDEEGELLGDEAAARDTYEGSQIELDSFFREFLVLELPMFPRRSDLPSAEGPATSPPPVEDGARETAIDPRLQPLAALRRRMRESKE